MTTVPSQPRPAARTATRCVPSLMRRLREHTAAVHAATEELPLMRHVLTERPTRQGLAHYLCVMHGVYTAVEPALYAALSPQLVAALGVRPKLPALRHDLHSLGGVDGRTLLPHAGLLSDVHRLLARAGRDAQATAIGGLYVLEGATLGGQLIARRLGEHWTCAEPLPAAFLNFRAGHDLGDWRCFGAAVDDFAHRHPGSDEAVLDGALGVFELMHAAMRGTASAP
jgi:heme oxygenase (biliverdin-IX-beta and delta-forming)